MDIKERRTIKLFTLACLNMEEYERREKKNTDLLGMSHLLPFPSSFLSIHAHTHSLSFWVLLILEPNSCSSEDLPTLLDIQVHRLSLSFSNIFIYIQPLSKLQLLLIFVHALQYCGFYSFLCSFFSLSLNLSLSKLKCILHWGLTIYYVFN